MESKTTKLATQVFFLFLLQVAFQLVPKIPAALSNTAFAANGQCRWEGGTGVLGGYDYCKAEDCLGNGGLARCTAGVGIPFASYSDTDVDANKWEYEMCDGQGNMSTLAMWCSASGGTWSSQSNGTCINLPAGSIGGQDAMNENRAISVSDTWVALYRSRCSTSFVSETQWGSTDNSTQCFPSGGLPTSRLGMSIMEFRQRNYTASGTDSSCSNISIMLRRWRDAKCPAGYKSRTGISGQECYIPAECCEARQGNPVSTISGSKFQEENDYSSPIAGGISFSRFYKSTGYFRIPSLSVLPGPLDKMQLSDFWHHNFDSHLYVVTGNSSVMAIQQKADGGLRSFDSLGKEVGNIDGAAATLAVVSNGYDLKLANSDVEHYDSTGTLTSITRQNGLIISFSYVGGVLNKISDSFGHALTLVYANGVLSTVTLPDAGVITYGYDSFNRLTSVTYPDGAKRQYTYTDARNQWLLTGIIDENAQSFATYAYDANGAMISESHAGGVESYQFTYGASSTTMTDPLGTTTQLGFTNVAGVIRMGSYSQQCATCGGYSNKTYDIAGNIASQTDFNGNQTTYVYDTTRNLETSRTEAAGTSNARTITTQWHPIFRSPALITEPGKTTGYTYDTNGNQLTKTITDTATGVSRTWTYTYNNYGQVLTIDGPRTDVNDVTTYTYYTCSTGYQCGQINTITNAAGQTTTFNTYNANGQPLTITDANGLLITLTYDARQRLASRTVGTETTAFDYWPTGLLKKATMPDGSYLNYTYDAAHRLTMITDNAGNSTKYTLDAMGNHTQESVYDVNGTLALTRTKVYDALGHLYQEIGAANQTITYSYDNAGNKLSTLDANYNYTQYGYDAKNRLSSMVDPANGLTQYSYNDDGNLSSVVDPKNLTTNYSYNNFGDLSQQQSPDTGTTINTYDSAGNIKTSKDANNNTVTYSYDALNRVTQASYSDQTITYKYDLSTNGKGHLTSLTDASGSTSLTYTSQGRINNKTQVMGSMTKSIGYGYNSAGQLTQLTTPSGQLINYTYSNGKVSNITVNAAPLLTQITYTAFGTISGWQWGNGTTTSRQYDTDGQLTQISDASTVTYTFNPNGSIASVADSNEVIPSLSAGQQMFTNATNSNKLNSISGSVTRTYTYDNVGHTLNDGSRSFTYNAAGRMITATNAGVSTTYTYNALGQRVKKSNSNSTTYFVYDEQGHLLGEYNATGALIQELVWLNDIPVATIRTDQSGGSVGVFYIRTDHLNAPAKITRPSDNAVIWRWDHDVYGNGVPNEDPDGNGLALNFNLRFPGQYYDQETGLLYNWNRYLDTSTGRYVSSDPIGLKGGINTYTYVVEDPVNSVDSNGLIKWTGNVFSFVVSAPFGAAYVEATLYSECVNGERERIEFTGIGPAAGLGVKASATVSEISFDDHEFTLNPLGFEGAFTMGTAAVTFGAIPIPPPGPISKMGPGLTGVGVGVGYIQFGQNFSDPLPPGIVVGRDKSVTGAVGSATVTSVTPMKCGCSTK